MSHSAYMAGSGGALLAKLDAGDPVFGVLALSPSAEQIEVLASVGFDYVMVDQMFSSVGWSELHEMVRAARGSGMAVIARIENDPWHGGDDLGASARAARAMGVGCDGVKANVYSAAQARAIVSAAQGWHRNIHVMPLSDDDVRDLQSSESEGAVVIPSVESELGIAETPEILEIDGLRVFGIAMSDTAVVLGHPLDYEHPDVWRFVDETVEHARSRSVHICAGTGYKFRTWDDIAHRVDRMINHDIKMIFIQTPEFLFQVSMNELIKKLRHVVSA